ncbi:MAG: pyruvate dehydrogenase [Bdellovibrionales bacterium]|nr:pyruvate dehydrogenase [Bdellovibrionales bacterium]
MASAQKSVFEEVVLQNIVSRAHYLATQMIYQANHRKTPDPGEPKVGGHSATSASSIHIQGAINLIVKTGFDHVVCKPHSSPADHAYNFLLKFLFDEKGNPLTDAAAENAMYNLRKFPENGEEVFQSYHSHYDPDHHNFLPTGSVGIPAVNLGYLALAYRYAREHGYVVPDAHFWAVIGDAEFKEGSLAEAIPDFAQREIGNLTWVVDYNRQSLDGTRYGNLEVFEGNDDTRIENMMTANGWDVIQLRHGRYRQELFDKDHGNSFKVWLEKGVSDEEMQALLQTHDVTKIMEFLRTEYSELNNFLDHVTPDDLMTALHDFGGHDLTLLVEALEESKSNTRKPTLIIAHTIKGWGLEMEAKPGNHSMIAKVSELDHLKKRENLPKDVDFAGFNSSSPEGVFLASRSETLKKDRAAQLELKSINSSRYLSQIEQAGGIPDSADVNFKLANHPHTQWMLGQITSKLTRIANTSEDKTELAQGQKPLSAEELRWKLPSEMIVTMSPDVGTSTNLNPSMDNKVYNPHLVEDSEIKLGIENSKNPKLVPDNQSQNRLLRFDIEEGNVMSCMGSFGKLRDLLGIPILPIMTIYDFFVKRALDQFFYNLYWKSSFICVGTPAGVTLSYEGAQHGWKSDLQIPNQIAWEPMFCQELDWIFADSVQRHFTNNNEGRTGVHIRNVTRGIQQKDLLKNLKKQFRFKRGLTELHKLTHKSYPMPNGVDESSCETMSEAEIFSVVREDVLKGAYYLVNYENYQGYDPGDNVINIFALGCMGSEALLASESLLEKGIYANVIVVTSSDLLAGNLAHETNYNHLRQGLGIDSKLYLSPKSNAALSRPEAATLSGRRIPIVSVHDGEPGFLDNLGSIVGVRQECLAVRKHSKCGGPKEIYHFHEIDADAIIKASMRALEETALEEVAITQEALRALTSGQRPMENHL